MKTTSRILAGIVPASLLVLLASYPGVAGAAPVRELLPPAAPSSPYNSTALGALLRANCNNIPATGIELTRALAKLGDFAQLPIPFSAVNPHSGLKQPRVVIAMAPHDPQPLIGPTFGSGGGWGGGSIAPSAAKLGPLTPLPSVAPNDPSLEGRLFLAANTEVDDRGRAVVKTVEFISWNHQRLAFDFGVIEGMNGGVPEIKTFDGSRCFSCHKNRGPILGVAPWSNSNSNPAVSHTAQKQLVFPKGLDQLGREDPKSGDRNDSDGLRLLNARGADVDAAVRLGAELLRDRATAELLAQSKPGKRVLTAALAAMISKKPILDDTTVKFELNRLDLVQFLRDEFAARKASAGSQLLDYNPFAAPVGAKPKPEAQAMAVGRYDAARARDDAALPSQHQPSNPKAFVKSPVRAAPKPSDVLGAVKIARAIGLSEEDRAFLAEATEIAAKGLGSPTTAAQLLNRTIAGPHFADVIETGVLPDRDDFKDRYIAGLREAAAKKGKTVEFDRKGYTSSPKRDPNAKATLESVALPSHACLACHDVRGAKPAPFNPIPALAFDPYDKLARETWLKTAPGKMKEQALGRLAKRLATDADMPPDDSREAELYAVKDPAELNAVREWVLAEWAKSRGK